MAQDKRTGDTRLKSASWRAIRAHWMRLKQPHCEATPCRLPGIPIRYTGRRGPDSLDVGHIVPRTLDTRTQWTIADTRPEHAHCSRSHGATIGNALRIGPARAPRPITADRW